MKKNAIVHMSAKKETVGSWFRRWHILPRLICLLLALIIWLTVYQASGRTEKAPDAQPVAGDTV